MRFRNAKDNCATALSPWRDPAVAECFGNVYAAYRFCVCKVCDGAGHAKHTGIAAGGQAHGVGGLRQQLAAGFVRRGMGIEQVGVEFGVGAAASALKPGRLNGAGPCNAGGDLIGTFGGRWQGKIGGGNRIDIDVQINPVKQRA